MSHKGWFLSWLSICLHIREGWLFLWALLPLFQTQFSFCLLTLELCLGSATKFCPGSDRSWEALYVNTPVCWGHLALPRGHLWPGGKTGEAHCLFPSPRGSLIYHSLVQWPSNSQRDWRITGPISSGFRDSITSKHLSRQTISRYQAKCLASPSSFS